MMRSIRSDTCLGELFGRDQQARIKDDKQKAIILHLTSGDGRTGQEAHGLNGKRQAVALVPGKRQDATQQHVPGIAGGLAVLIYTHAFR